MALTELQDIFLSRGIEWPRGKTLAAMLERGHFEELGKIRFGDTTHRYYSRNAQRFKSYGESVGYFVDQMKVRDYLTIRRIALTKYDLDDV